jgi:enoyl-CoA hydratase/carnithine racemase
MDALTLPETIICARKDGIALVTLNRPKVLNALNRQTLVDLLALMGDLRVDPLVSGVVLTGAGERAFAAGADINELAKMSPVEAQALSHLGHALMESVETLGKPVIAAVNGYALGGGCELAMACTIRIASENAVFGQPEVTLGLIPGYGGSQRLPRLVGKGRAMQIVLTGKSIHAAEAYRIGLVNEVVAPGELLSRAEAILASMTVNAPAALRLAMEAVNGGLDSTLADGCALEAALFGLCAATEDRAEGTAAFLAKRKPAFAGR